MARRDSCRRSCRVGSPMFNRIAVHDAVFSAVIPCDEAYPPPPLCNRALIRNSLG